MWYRPPRPVPLLTLGKSYSWSPWLATTAGLSHRHWNLAQWDQDTAASLNHRQPTRSQTLSASSLWPLFRDTEFWGQEGFWLSFNERHGYGFLGRKGSKEDVFLLVLCGRMALWSAADRDAVWLEVVRGEKGRSQQTLLALVESSSVQKVHSRL